MARASSFILIAAIAIASFFVEPAAGQFPKIRIPKIITTATPTAPNTTVQSNGAIRVPTRLREAGTTVFAEFRSLERG